jgi:hypothetical protein
VTHAIIDNCDTLPHVGDRQRWRPVSEASSSMPVAKLDALIDPRRNPPL